MSGEVGLANDVSKPNTLSNQNDFVPASKRRLRGRDKTIAMQYSNSFNLAFVISCLNRKARLLPKTKTFFENLPLKVVSRTMTIKTSPADVSDVADSKAEQSQDNSHIERTSTQFRQRVNSDPMR